MWLKASGMDHVLDLIDDALRRKGLSDAAASKLAVGNYALIKNMRSARSEDKRYNFQSLQKLAEVLDLECYFGPPRDVGPVSVTEIDGEVYAAVPRYDAQLAAGAGRQNPDQAAVGAIAFRRDWLNREGIAPGQAMVLGVCGDSMAPTLCDGDLVMIDRRKTAPVNRRIYALIGPGDEARVKRVERLPAALLLHSDNEDFPTEIIAPSDANRIRILGEVVWWGHTVKDS